MLIRRATIDDSEKIHEAHMESIRNICAKLYSEQEIRAWGYRPFNEEIRRKSISEELVWVLEDNGHLLGYGHLSPNGSIRALYLRPAAAGRGYGKQMLGE